MISVTKHNGLGVINNESLQNIVKVFNDEANEVGKDTKLGQTFDIYGNFVSKMSIKGITYPGRAELLYFLTSVLKGKDSFEKCVKQAIFDDSCYVASLVRDEIGKNQYHKLDVVTATEETLAEEDYSKIMTSFRINTGITCVENVGSSEEKSYKIEGCLYHKIGENKILIATNSEKVTDNSILKFDNTWKRFVIPDSLGNMTHFYVKGSLIITYGDSVSSASIRTAKSAKEFCEKSQCRKLKDNEQKEIDDLLIRICSII